jgi:hypothetical protein
VQAKLELGDDAEVAAAAAQAPEEVGVLLCARLHELTVGGDQVHRNELVDRQAVLALKPADAAAESQASDPGVGDDPTGRREPERLRLAVQLAPEDAGLSPRRAGSRVDPDPPHRPQVDDDAAVADRLPGEAVPPAADRNPQAAVAREPHSRDHVRDAGAPRDERRGPINRPVPDLAVLVVVRVRRPDQLAPEGRFERAQDGPVEPDLGIDGAHAPSSACRRPRQCHIKVLIAARHVLAQGGARAPSGLSRPTSSPTSEAPCSRPPIERPLVP